MMLREFSGQAGRLEALLGEPAAGEVTGQPSLAVPRAAVALAHPHPQHGGTMHTKVVYQTAKALQRIGCAVLRYNFRGTGVSQGEFDGGPGEMADHRAALNFLSARYPGRPLWSAGFSFGAWIALNVGAIDDRVSTLIGIAPPVGEYDFAAVEASEKPKFLIQGERDELFPLARLRAFYAHLREPKELVVIDAADHLFDGKVSEVGDAIEDLLGDYEG
jgi:alpha/beta superfamily hydrolase